MIFYIEKGLKVINKDCPKCAAGECGKEGCSCYDSKNEKDQIYKDGGRQK